MPMCSMCFKLCFFVEFEYFSIANVKTHVCLQRNFKQDAKVEAKVDYHVI